MTTSREESVKMRARVEKGESLNIIMLDEGRISCWLFQGSRKQDTRARVPPVVESASNLNS